MQYANKTVCYRLVFRFTQNQESFVFSTSQQLFAPGFSAQQFVHLWRRTVELMLKPFPEVSAHPAGPCLELQQRREAY
jgi:hypothetical protein